MINRLICIILIIWTGCAQNTVSAQSRFVYPGITYMKGDFLCQVH